MDHSEIKHLPKVDHTPAELEEENRLLLKAAALIERHGLAKGCQRDSQGRMCVAGAIIVAAGGEPNSLYGYPTKAAERASDRFSKAVDSFVEYSSGYRIYGPAIWNNKPERTVDQVVAKLRAVALGSVPVFQKATNDG